MDSDYKIYASCVSAFIAIISAILSYRSYRTNRIENVRNKNEFICMQCEDKLDDCYMRVNNFSKLYLLMKKDNNDELEKMTDRENILYQIETIRNYFNYPQLYDLRGEYADASILLSDITYENKKMTAQDLMKIRTSISSLKSKVMRKRSAVS